MEEKRVIKTRRVGSVTLGIVLIIWGSLFLLSMMFPALNYEMIFRLWPLMFISLGIEVLVSSRRPDERMVYDGAAIFILVLLVVFAMGMAGIDWLFVHYNECPGHVIF